MEKKKLKPRGRGAKPVKQMTTEGKLVKIWESAIKVKELGWNPVMIGRICRAPKKEKHVYKGFLWEFVNEEDREKKKIKKDKKLIVKHKKERIDNCNRCGREFIAQLDNMGVPYLRTCPVCRKLKKERTGAGILGKI